MRRWLALISPWTVLVAVPAITVGALAGVGGFTFFYARGASYMTDDPSACVNCHVMRPQFEGWLRSSHRAVAGCNDCHTPNGFLDHWIVKAENGWHHSFAFTTQEFHEPIQITDRNAAVTEAQCRSCHAEMVWMVDAVGAPHAGSEGDDADEVRCTRCHRSVGHAH